VRIITRMYDQSRQDAAGGANVKKYAFHEKFFLSIINDNRRGLFPGVFIEGKLHKPNHFFIQVPGCAHAEMVIELLRTRYLGDLMETEIFSVRLIKGEHDIHEIFSQPGDIGHPCPGSKRDHAFSRMHRNLADLLIPVGEMFEQ
jgi:hypothetical protein